MLSKCSISELRPATQLDFHSRPPCRSSTGTSRPTWSCSRCPNPRMNSAFCFCFILQHSLCHKLGVFVFFLPCCMLSYSIMSGSTERQNVFRSRRRNHRDAASNQRKTPPRCLYHHSRFTAQVMLFIPLLGRLLFIKPRGHQPSSEVHFRPPARGLSDGFPVCWRDTFRWKWGWGGSP